MLKASTRQHLRFPFSFFLFPLFAFAASQYPINNWSNLFLVLIILNFLLYPASNGYNTYYDRDEESIGGIEHPMPVTRQLLRVAWLMDGIAVLLSFCLSWRFALMVLVYSFVSKAYSHPAIRLKRFPVISLAILALFQGFFTYGMVVLGILDLAFTELLRAKVLLPAMLSSLLLTGFYPLTQVYQHREDSRRGDRTISLVLGIRGTFSFSGIIGLLSLAGFYTYFITFYNKTAFWTFASSLIPVAAYFLFWFFQVLKDESKADFKHVHRFLLLAASLYSMYFLVFYCLWYWI